MSYTPLYSLVNFISDLYKTPYSSLYPLHTLIRKRVCNGECTIPEEYIPLVNSHDNQGIPPLFYANCIHDTKWLLQHNANVNYNNFVYSSIQEQYSFLQGCNDISTILESVIERKHIDVAKILIEHGAKTSTYFVKSKTMPISYAAFFRYDELIETMIEHKTKVWGVSPRFIRNYDEKFYFALWNLPMEFIKGVGTFLYYEIENVRTYHLLLAHTKLEPTYFHIQNVLEITSYDHHVTFFAHLKSSFCMPYRKKHYSHPYSIPWVYVTFSDNPEKTLKLLIASNLFRRRLPGRKKRWELKRRLIFRESIDALLEVIKDVNYPTLFDLISLDLLFQERNEFLENLRIEKLS